jgi:hypothetical protein
MIMCIELDVPVVQVKRVLLLPSSLKRIVALHLNYKSCSVRPTRKYLAGCKLWLKGLVLMDPEDAVVVVVTSLVDVISVTNVVVLVVAVVATEAVVAMVLPVTVLLAAMAELVGMELAVVVVDMEGVMEVATVATAVAVVATEVALLLGTNKNTF